jgi:hypothetical protein
MELASQGPARELAVFKDFRERSPLLSSFYSNWATTNIRDDDLMDWLRRLFHMNDDGHRVAKRRLSDKEESTALPPSGR